MNGYAVSLLVPSTVFQRDFIAQTGDPTGTGRGGESIYRSASQQQGFSSLLMDFCTVCMCLSGFAVSSMETRRVSSMQRRSLASNTRRRERFPWWTMETISMDHRWDGCPRRRIKYKQSDEDQIMKLVTHFDLIPGCLWLIRNLPSVSHDHRGELGLPGWSSYCVWRSDRRDGHLEEDQRDLRR